MLDALVIGGDSRIGEALIKELRGNGFQVEGTSRRQGAKFPLDLMHGASSALPDAKVVYICAGVNGFKECDADPFTAAWVNTVQTIAVARKADKAVWLSSSAAANNTSTVYGALKLVTERALLPSAAVVRFGPVIKTGNEYANGDYPPISLETLTKRLAGLMTDWKSGLIEVRS